jgi:hypothetical protein
VHLVGPIILIYYDAQSTKHKAIYQYAFVSFWCWQIHSVTYLNTQLYVPKYQKNYSETQEQRQVSKTLHTEGKRDTFTTLHDCCCTNSTPGYNLWYSWHWAMLSTAMGFRTANWHCLPASTLSQCIRHQLPFLCLTSGNIHRYILTNLSLLLHA